MAFALETGRPLGEAMSAAARGEIEKALARLRGDHVSADDVHDARKSGKKLRGWLRLVRPELGERYTLINALLRDAGRHLAARRDAHVAYQTLLRMRRGRRLTAEQFRMLGDALGALQSDDPAADDVIEAKRLLKAAQVYLTTFEVPLDAELLRQRLEQNRARCLRGLKRCKLTRRAEDLHDWRKRVKYFGYQCALVAPALEDAGQAIDALKLLGETLGLHHDFHAFATRLEACPPQRIGELLKLRARQVAQARMDALTERALAQGRQLFDPVGTQVTA